MWLPPDDERLPQDFCTYFWGLIGRAFFVFGIGGTFLGLLITGLVFIILWLWAHKFGASLALGGIALFVLLIWISERKKKAKIEFLSDVKAVIKGKVDAVKNRYCPRIEWRKP